MICYDPDLGCPICGPRATVWSATLFDVAQDEDESDREPAMPEEGATSAPMRSINSFGQSFLHET